MALRIPSPTGVFGRLGAPTLNFGRRASSFISVVAAASKQQQQQQKKKNKKEMWSPLQTIEEIASQFGLEIAISDLERLFREAGGDPPAHPGESLHRRRPVRVVYQGGRGSYCQEAAERAFPALSCDSFPCTNMEDAFSALEDQSADRAIVPAENSIDGPIDRNIDLLLRHQDVSIVGELVLPVDHCLISLRGTPVSSLRRVVSHPQALSHCRGRLEELDLEVDEVDSAADAARFLAESRAAGTAVIGSKAAAKEFGLEVLEHNFQDPAVNFNRYLQLGLGSGSDLETRSGRTRKTTVAFSLEGGVADLFRAMWVFETRGVRVTRVDHRPNRSNPVRLAGRVAYFNYVFVMDLEGSRSDPKVRSALTGLEEIAAFVRVLGSYSSNL
ncbi:arogenate dehydratase/prephenate dehydratase 6, chloroplastic-like [Iris pallida]|uniref:Arogenate dehydratase/prephenate dehydratase 6, chloroplastic-like n=1 Tax=Iris pallida TaxID=29817 RepID=A0AAX6DQU5_IRIPA|nr:arogenate dehydratase/prephenate dehydratase 6, chloroplastic-like [Iris pallida]